MEDCEEYVYIINTDTPQKAEQYMIEELLAVFGSIDNTTQGSLSVETIEMKEGVLASFWLAPEN